MTRLYPVVVKRITGGGGGVTPEVVWGPSFGNPPEGQVAIGAGLLPYAIGDLGATAAARLAGEAVLSGLGAAAAAAADLEAAVLTGGPVAQAIPQIVALTMSGHDVDAIVESAIGRLVATYSFDPAAAATLLRYGLLNYMRWANAVEINSPAFTNPNNLTDQSTMTAASITATSSGIGGITSNTTNGDISVSHPDAPAPIDTFTIDTVEWLYRWSLTSGGTLPIGQAATVNVRYSTDDGASWTTQETVALPASDPGEKTVDLTSVLTSWTLVNQFRTRFDGSVTSGTGSGATVTFNAFSTRLRIQAHKDNP